MLNETSSHDIKHTSLLCMASLFGNRKSKGFEGLIGIKMWNGFKAPVKHLKDELCKYQGNGDYFASTIFKKDWTTAVDRVSLQISMESTDDLLTRTVCMCRILKQGMDDLSTTCTRENKTKYKNDIDFWGNLMFQCKNSMTQYIEYCQTISDLDENNTWDTCDLAVYLIQKNVTKEEAVNFCKKFGVITFQQFEEIDRTDIYGDVTNNKDGLSMSIAEKNDLDLLLLTMKAKVDAAPAALPLSGKGRALILSDEIRDRGLLLEQLRQLNAPRYTLGGFFTPAGKKDVKTHQQYLANIKGPMDDLSSIIDSVYQGKQKIFLQNMKETFDRLQQMFKDNFQWYTGNTTIEDALTTFGSIKNLLTQVNGKAKEHMKNFFQFEGENEVSTAAEACYAPLDAYIAYMKGLISKK